MVAQAMRVLWLSLLLLISANAAAQSRWLTPEEAAPGYVGQLRGMWVDAYGPGFKSPEEITTLIADAKRLGLNALFVQVVKRGDCYCLRSSLPVADDPALAPGFDPLDALIKAAYPEGIQVHAWVVTTALWGAEEAPRDAAHLYNTHGPDAPESWLSVRYDGATRPDKDVYLDPGVPAVADYLAGAVVSLAENYAIDGLAFDRLRYPDYNLDGAPSWGYNPISLARYQQETAGEALPHPTDPTWTAWRREQVSLLERRLYLEAKRVNPKLWISAATIAYGQPPATFAETTAYQLVLQDWAGWLKAGYLDLNLPMNYKLEDGAEQADWFTSWNAFALAQQADARTAVAIGMYRNSPAESKAQIAQVEQTSGLLGWVGYSYRTPTASADEGWELPVVAFAAVADALAGAAAPTRVSGAPATTAILGHAEVPGAAAVELLARERVIAQAKTDSTGYYGFVMKGAPSPANSAADKAADKAINSAAGQYWVRLKGGVAVPVRLEPGAVVRPEPLTHLWLSQELSQELSQSASGVEN